MSTLAGRFEELRGLLEGASRVVVSGHEKADGDAVGAVAALRRHLEIEDKDVTAVLLEPLSARYDFMEFARHYTVFDPARHERLLADAEIVILCDLSSLSRLGALEAPLRKSTARTVCFDHHPCENGGPADLNLLDSKATATGRIVWDYIRHVGARVDREIAESVFVSLSTDTGWFRYGNTDASVVGLAAELAGHRLDLPGIYRSIYQANSVPLLRLLGHVVRSLNSECGGAFVWATVSHAMVAELGVERLDVDPILDVLRSADDVAVVALFTELPDRRVSVSLRSRGTPDVNRIARKFGGGGHVHASGTVLEAEHAERDRRALVAEIRRALRAT